MESPLVSILIITYNSSEYILETLDSAYNQTYQNIELVVSDDCSSDNTVEVVRNWVKEHEHRFVGCKIVDSIINTGIPANCNRGVRACCGEWIRMIAGDDMLVVDGIEKQVQFAKDSMNIIVGDILFFKEENNRKPYKILQHGKDYPWFFDRGPEYQYSFLLYNYNFGLGISTLVRRKIYDEVTMYDERYPLEEDTLFQLNVTKAGYKYYYIESPVTLYRVHDSVSNCNSNVIMKLNYEKTKRKIKHDNIYPEIPFYNISYWTNELIDLIEFYLALYIFDNKKSVVSVRLFKILDRCRLLNYRNKIDCLYNKYIWNKKNKSDDTI